MRLAESDDNYPRVVAILKITYRIFRTFGSDGFL
jgi:hypothetical protein